MERNLRILILKVLLKGMLLFAALWLLWAMMSSIPGGPPPRHQSALQPALPRTSVCCHTAALTA